ANQLEELADELRTKMIRTVSQTGGHLASSLGTVELTLALHRVMDSPRDRIVWDTGHQAYANKLLTRRAERLATPPPLAGSGGFPPCGRRGRRAFSMAVMPGPASASAWGWRPRAT